MLWRDESRRHPSIRRPGGSGNQRGAPYELRCGNATVYKKRHRSFTFKRYGLARGTVGYRLWFIGYVYRLWFRGCGLEAMSGDLRETGASAGIAVVATPSGR